MRVIKLSSLFFLLIFFLLIEFNYGSLKIYVINILLFKSFFIIYFIIINVSLLKYCDKCKIEMCIVKFELNSIVVNFK